MCKYCEGPWENMRTLKGVDEWEEGDSLVEELRDKCVVNITRIYITRTTESSLDKTLGLIAIIMLHDILCEGASIKSKIITFKGASRKSEMFTFKFAKKHIEKIKKIEKAYMSGKIQVDAKQMSMAFASVIDSLIETSLITIRPIVLTSIKKSKARK